MVKRAEVFKIGSSSRDGGFDVSFLHLRTDRRHDNLFFSLLDFSSLTQEA